MPFKTGDVFGGIGNGRIGHYSPSGTRLDTLDSTTNSFETAGMAFDDAGNLYGTDFQSSAVSKYDSSGNLLGQFTGGPMQNPESIVQDKAGNFYVGQAGPGVFIKPDHPLLKFDSSGHFVKEFFPAVESRGVDWIDLSADQCTLLYTSEGKRILRFDVCQNKQLPDFATLPILGPVASGGEVAFALRIRPNGEVLVAAWTRVFRLDANGNIIQQYVIPGAGPPGFNDLFALNLDPDGKSFWTAIQGNGTQRGQVFKVDIATGAILATWNAQPETQLSGLAVFGELTAAKPDDPIAVTGTTINATEGAGFTGTVASFTDPDTRSAAGEYSATIDWGDGSSSSGSITGTGGSFTVSGSNTYAEEGTYPVKVKITDVDNSTNTATANSMAKVADAALSSQCAVPATTLPAFAGPTATFTDADPGGSQPPDYTATIDWGDGSSSNGVIPPGMGHGPYTVNGAHTYTSTGTHTITTTITDAGGSTTVSKCQALVFAFAPGGGSFVIGDRNSATGTHVTFWGAQWWKLNSLSGAIAPASFKGFAENPMQPSCATGWSTDPGNSAPPPNGPLPPHMGVIVSSTITKSGSQISGDTPHIVVVKTDPGYQPNPGHPGTGTVEAQVC